ncbi:MAG: membrane-bound lytic murein transglycosylase MltF, partial [Alphaproteobacteria bacterium]
FLTVFDYYDTKVFKKRLKDTLPKFEPYFKKAGETYNIPWMVLAAQSYQESHWKPKAKSPAGAAGLMMLTKSTAKLLKIKNRFNPKGSNNA